MSFKKLGLVGLVCAGAMGVTTTYANEVLLVTNQVMNITYKIAHKSASGEIVLGQPQTTMVDKSMQVHVDLGDYERAGIVLVSADGHELPPTISEFDKPGKCSITTDKTRANGALQLDLSPHTLSCRTYGGVYS